MTLYMDANKLLITHCTSSRTLFLLAIFLAVFLPMFAKKAILLAESVFSANIC